ncbi:hypothetical protein Ate02nite_96300 [Paractinoplanes tereljensis]|uniref:DUF11 domain-containing protein n=1 Tax=Paractinoplanes tereljensis TaxID=571912 RepID=A0A919U035_9ACTN|nr:hypothetical protein Ate02nite_96300 [Actinoplanes tereljensis]
MSEVANLTLLSSVTTGALRTACQMSTSQISGSSSVADLKVGSGTAANVSASTSIDLSPLLKADVNKQSATWDSGTGLLTYTVQALDVDLLSNSGLGTVASSEIAVAESICSGKVRLGPVKVTKVALAAGASGTPTVSVDNTGDAAAPNTVITVPLPPTGYQLGTVTSTGGGTCATDSTKVTCSGVTVPAGGTATVSLPVTRAVSATAAAAWAPSSGIDAISTPIAAVTGTTIESRGSGTLVTPQGASVGGLTVTVAAPPDGSLSPGDNGELTVTALNTAVTSQTNVPYAFLAPNNTTFRTPTVSYCTLTNSRRVDCTLSVNALATLKFPLPIKVDSTADPDVPLTGGCADAGHDGTCTIPPDTAIDTIKLGAIAIGATTVTVKQGESGNGVLKVRSNTAIALTTVRIPLSTLPSGFHVTSATGPSGGSACVLTSTLITCAAVPLLAGVDTPITVATSVDTGVANGVIWHATGITVTAGPKVVTGSADLVRTPADAATVTFTVTSPTGTVAPGGTTSLTVTGVNSSTVDATNRTATIKAPANATFGTLTGATASACTVTSSTVLTCAYSLTAGNTLTWTLPLKVATTAQDGDKVANGCVTADGDTTCGGSQDVRLQLATHGTLTVGGAIIKPGESGTATVSLSATADFDDLTLTVPLDDLPDDFTVDSADLGSDSCTAGTASVICTGVALVSGTARNLRLGVTVGSEISTDTVWRASGVTLVRADDTNDRLTASGVLVSTSATTFSVSVTVGAVSPTSPAPGQTTVLPITVKNTGPGTADPYPVTIMIPDGATHGTLPDRCVEGSTDRIVVCTESLAAGDSVLIKLPLIIDDGLASGTVITGGCVDQALSSGTPTFNYTCGESLDVAIPDFTVGQYDVDLGVTYSGGTVPLAGTTQPVVKLPYSNGGSAMADNVTFTIEPPTGVWIVKAEVLVDSSSQQAAGVGKQADSTVEATCAAATTGNANDVTCAAPDAAAESGHQLWLTLKLGAGVQTGTQAMRVTVTTTSDDGYAVNNTVDVPLALTAQDTDDDDSLPTTGADVARLGLLSVILLAFGLVLIIGARQREAVPATGVRHRSDRKPRHARPFFNRSGTATRAPAGSRASAEGIDGASRAARPADRAPRPPAHAKSEPARRHRSDGSDSAAR